VFEGQGKGKTNGNSGPAFETSPHKRTTDEVTFNLVFGPQSKNTVKKYMYDFDRQSTLHMYMYSVQSVL